MNYSDSGGNGPIKKKIFWNLAVKDYVSFDCWADANLISYDSLPVWYYWVTYTLLSR